MMAPTNLLLQLWVRAQRNTSARLVLDSCFVLTLEPPQERMRVTAGARSGKVILQNMDINETPRYVARYVKNEIQYDYEEHARLVNEMVEQGVSFDQAKARAQQQMQTGTKSTNQEAPTLMVAPE